MWPKTPCISFCVLCGSERALYETAQPVIPMISAYKHYHIYAGCIDAIFLAEQPYEELQSLSVTYDWLFNPYGYTSL